MRQISTPNVSVISTQPYFLNSKRNLRRNEPLNEPMIDYDQSDVEDMFDRRYSQNGNNRRPSKLMEIGGQTAVFVATPAAAEIMRRQGSERLMFARPI